MRDIHKEINLDYSTGALDVIEYAHHEVHAGSYFYVMYSVVDLGAMTTPDDAITLSWKTSDTRKWGHFEFWAKGSADWRLRLIEAPTGGAATPTGTKDIINKNRNSSKSSTFMDLSSVPQVVSYDATLATGGVTLWDEYLEGSGGPQSGGSSSATRQEIILKQNTQYQVSLYGTAADPATLFIGWYEHAEP